MLAGAGRWTPDRGCAWQRGIDYVLEAANTQPSPGHTRLRDDARFVGPVWLDLPTGRPDEPLVAQPVYLPAHAPEWSKRFVASCKLRPAINSVGDAELQDPGRRAGATIRLPRAGADTQVLALGAGSLELHDAVRVDAGGELWITGRAGEHGIVELLEPATAALESMDRPVQRAHVGACPMLYPDPIRILFQRGLWPESGARDARSARLTDALIRSGATLDPIAVERDGGFAMRLGSGTVQLYLLDRLAEIEVLDLRALGYVLWLVFVGEAEVASELGGQLALSNLDRLLDTKASPFEPRDWVYQRIAGSSGDLGLRTATLARLLVAYPGSEAGMSRVLAGAARSFVTWAHGSELAPLGRPPRRIATLLKLTTGDELTLAVDALET